MHKQGKENENEIANYQNYIRRHLYKEDVTAGILKIACGALWFSGTHYVKLGKFNAESHWKVGPTLQINIKQSSIYRLSSSLKQFERFSSSLTQDVYSMT